MKKRAGKTLTIELIPIADKDLRLDDFLEEMGAVESALHETERLLSGKDPSLFFNITRLQKNSPALIDLEPEPANNDQRSDALAHRLAHRFTVNLSVIKSGHRPRKINVPTLQSYEELTKPLTRRGLEAVVTSGGSSVKLDRKFRDSIRAVLGEDEVALGSLSGRIEKMSTHGRRNTFTLYPVVGADKVIGHFRNKDRGKFTAAMDKYVTVWGRVKHKTWDAFPYEIIADQVVVHETHEDLIRLRGISPHATGTMSTQEFIDLIRDE